MPSIDDNKDDFFHDIVLKVAATLHDEDADNDNEDNILGIPPMSPSNIFGQYTKVPFKSLARSSL